MKFLAGMIGAVLGGILLAVLVDAADKGRVAGLVAAADKGRVECYTAAELDWMLRFAVEGNR